MARQTQPTSPEIESKQTNAACRILVVYEDLPALLRVARVLRQLQAAFAEDLHLAMDYLSFTQIETGHKNSAAGPVALPFDLLIVAARASAQVSPRFRTWLAQVSRNQRTTPSLLALFAVPDPTPASDCSLLSAALEHCARASGMDWLEPSSVASRGAHAAAIAKTPTSALRE